MKIVTYNVNSLRARVNQHGSLLKLLDALDADIVCFQETKLSRHDLTADLTTAEGYEAFFSCTRTSCKGRVSYSGVASFCRVKSSFSSNEPALPIAAQEGITGLLESRRRKGMVDEFTSDMDFLKDITKDDLLKVDSEGRCVITDHDHFVLFNVYGPRAESDDPERLQFKLMFFRILQAKWNFLLKQGKRVLVVGDLNIAPSAIDCWNAGPDFEKNMFRKWLRSLLVDNGGPFFDVFRAKHPTRKNSYTCWSQVTGAEKFNCGSRIDHILFAGSCLHQRDEAKGHNFIDCHVRECDILSQFMRDKSDSLPRCLYEKTIKMKGSDHAPVYIKLDGIPNLHPHNTPPLAVRYHPAVRGLQQTIVPMLLKRQASAQMTIHEVKSLSRENVYVDNGGKHIVSLCDDFNQTLESKCSEILTGEDNTKMEILRTVAIKPKKKMKGNNCSQLTLQTFFQIENSHTSVNIGKSNVSLPSDISNEGTSFSDCDGNTCQNEELHPCSSTKNGASDSLHCEEKSDFAMLEWKRIQQLMQNTVPKCKGHGEPCVARIVKQRGPNIGRGFYVCARAQGPSSNPEARCNYFQWATTSKSKQKDR